MLIRQVSPTLAKIAKEELNENPNQIQSNIEYLREWIQKQPHLKARISDQFLITFLRGNKYSLERAKSKIDMYYTLRASLPDYFSNRKVDDPKTVEILRIGVGIKLLQTDSEDGPRVSIIRPGAYDPEKYSFAEIIKVGTIVGDISLLEDDNAVICGHIEILDLANVTAAHFFQLDPIVMKKLTIIGQEATPLRHKGFHIINAPAGFEKFYNMFKSVMSEKNQKRIYIHGKNFDSLYNFVPRKILPPEYGGQGDSIQDILNYWEKKLISYKEYFEEDESYGIDENLRIDLSKKADSLFGLFGLDGSFRKLNID